MKAHLLRAIAVLVCLSCAGRVEAQDTDEHQRRLHEVLERLELGLSALEELGRADAHAVVAKVADEVRAELKGQRRENDEIATVRKRLKVMRTAVEAFVEAGRMDAAELVESAMHARELAIEGRRDEEAQRIRAAAPNRAALAETLAAAAKLYKQWNKPYAAKDLAELAETYAAQWRRIQQSDRRESERRSNAATDGLDDLGTRVRIFSLARDAFAEAGDAKNTRVLEGVLYYGELLLGGEGVTDAQLEEARAAMPSQGNLIEYLMWSERHYAEAGRKERAQACRSLAEYYRRRMAGANEGEEHEHERHDGEDRDPTHEREGHDGEDRDHPPEHDGDEGHERRDVNLTDRANRMEILWVAHIGLAEAGHEEWAGMMRRFLRGGQMQDEGASPEEVAVMFDGLTMGMMIELLQKVSGLYAGWGHEGSAKSCNDLAEFYAARERERARTEEVVAQNAPPATAAPGAVAGPSLEATLHSIDQAMRALEEARIRIAEYERARK